MRHIPPSQDAALEKEPLPEALAEQPISSSTSAKDVTTLISEAEHFARSTTTDETLACAAHLLGELSIQVEGFTLDCHGSIKNWQPEIWLTLPHAMDTSCQSTVSTCAVSVEGIRLEAAYRAPVESQSTGKAVYAVLRVAATNIAGQSRRLWQYENDELRFSLVSRQPSLKARALSADIERVARLPYSILITGETGTGKTHSARQIHARSARADSPFLELNCANLPEQLVEAELFGYRKGAFTGADRDHKGLFEEADGGILFLDEIGDVPPSVQNKLLKAIDEKQIKRLGTNHYFNCDVQIIAATSRNLEAMIREGSFREDLYCRLAVLTFEIAPLRERREDIPTLIAQYLREAARAVFKDATCYPIEYGAVELLCAFDYPGNIRALRNIIYELTSYVARAETITVEHVQPVLHKAGARRTSGKLCASTTFASTEPTTGEARQSSDTLLTLPRSIYDALQTLAKDGDIVLPLELCIIRQGETFSQWITRAKISSIQAARSASDGTLESAARRLGVSCNTLKGHFYRAINA